MIKNGPLALIVALVVTSTTTVAVKAMSDLNQVTELMLFSDEIMVQSATKRLQKLSEVPGSVTIITAKEIEERGALTIYEALNNMTGVSFANEGLFNTMRFRGMQASYNNKILLLVDGRKVNVLDWGNYDGNFGTNLDNVKQIEVIKGPGSSLYGANAYAGVISIITKTGAEIGGLKTEMSVSNKPGDFEVSQKYSLTYGTKQDGLDYKVSASYWRQLGIDPFNDPRPNDLYEGEDANFSLNLKDIWTLQGGYHRSSEPWSGSVYTPTPRNNQKMEMLYLDSTYTLGLNELSKLKLHISDNYNTSKFLETELWDLDRQKINSAADLPTPTPSIIVTDKGDMQPVTNAIGNYYIGVNDFLRIVSGSGLDVVGLGKGQMNEFIAEVQYDLSWPQNNYLLAGINMKLDWSNQIYFVTDQVTDNNYAAYIQDEYHLADKLILLSGLRFDYNRDYGNNLSPRESLIYEPLKGLRFKGLYGSAFRSPVMLERYSNTDYGFYEATGNPDVKPESIQQSEASVEYELGKWLQAKANYFYWETQNEIQFVYTFGSLYVYSPDLSLISPLMPAVPGLFYATPLNVAPALVSWDNSNSRIGHGLELETSITPTDYARIKLNYSRVNLYAREKPAHPSWAQGVADVGNGVLELHYKNVLFFNFYAHISRTPMTIDSGSTATSGPGAEVTAKWLPQYDVSLGCNYQGLSLVGAVYNIFNNPVAYDTLNDNYLKAEPIYRLNASYTLKF